MESKHKFIVCWNTEICPLARQSHKTSGVNFNRLDRKRGRLLRRDCYLEVGVSVLGVFILLIRQIPPPSRILDVGFSWFVVPVNT